ncbi:MAG: hypothetical protein E3K37_06590 [Candidatus Kuenenia sp.]|nr:hypothetical protein [Candidatus Kuenenia hertensis]
MIEYDLIEPDKQKLLEDNEFLRDDRDFYVSKTQKKVFSFQRIRNESVVWLEQEINKPNTTGKWQFFCNNYPSEGLQADIINPYL